MSATETLEQACKRAQRVYADSRGTSAIEAAADERRRVFSQAIERGVSYRRLAKAVGLAPGTVHAMMSALHVKRLDDVDPFGEPVWDARCAAAGISSRSANAPCVAAAMKSASVATRHAPNDTSSGTSSSSTMTTVMHYECQELRPGEASARDAQTPDG